MSEREDYQAHVIAKIWSIVKPDEESEYDTNNLYSYVLEGVAAKKRLAEGERAIKEFVISRTEEAFREFDNSDSAVGTAVLAERARYAKIADGILVAAGRLRRGYGELHPGIENFAQSFERAAREIKGNQ